MKERLLILALVLFVVLPLVSCGVSPGPPTTNQTLSAPEKKETPITKQGITEVPLQAFSAFSGIQVESLIGEKIRLSGFFIKQDSNFGFYFGAFKIRIKNEEESAYEDFILREGGIGLSEIEEVINKLEYEEEVTITGTFLGRIDPPLAEYTGAQKEFGIAVDELIFKKKSR